MEHLAQDLLHLPILLLTINKKGPREAIEVSKRVIIAFGLLASLSPVFTIYDPAPASPHMTDVEPKRIGDQRQTTPSR